MRDEFAFAIRVEGSHARSLQGSAIGVDGGADGGVKFVHNVRCVPTFAYTLLSVGQLWLELKIDSLFADSLCCRLHDGTELPYVREKQLPTLLLVSVAGCDPDAIARSITRSTVQSSPTIAALTLTSISAAPPNPAPASTNTPGLSTRHLGHHSVHSSAHIARLPAAQAGELMHRRCHASLRYIQAIANTTADGPRNVASASAINCASCAEARITQAAHRGTLSTPAPEAGVLHVDLKEMVISAEGFRYFLVAVDEFTRFIFIAFLKYKSEAGAELLAIRDEFVVEPSMSVASNHGHVADFSGDVFGAGGCTERVSARAAVDEPVWVGRDVPSAPRVDGAADDAATGRFFAGRLDCGFQAFWGWRRRVCDESGEQEGRWRRIWRRRKWVRVAR